LLAEEAVAEGGEGGEDGGVGFGSTVVILSGFGPPGTLLKYFSSMGIASLAFKSPATATTMFDPT